MIVSLTHHPTVLYWRFGHWVTPAKQVCWLFTQGANSSTLPSTTLDILGKNQFQWRKSYWAKYHKTHLCAMPTIASGRMHFPLASEAQYGSRYRSISFSRIASNNKLISCKSSDKLLLDLGWFWIGGMVDRSYFFVLCQEWSTQTLHMWMFIWSRLYSFTFG